MLPIPKLLNELIRTGHWPSNEAEQTYQNANQQLISTENVRKLAPEESKIYLLSPPFYTVSALINQGDYFWSECENNLEDISPDFCMEIAHFGLDSDVPILLDYLYNSDAPRVIRLRYARLEDEEHEWLEMSPSFESFAQSLNLKNLNYRR